MSDKPKRSIDIPKQLIPGMSAKFFVNSIKSLYTKPIFPKIPTIDTSIFRTIDSGRKLVEDVLRKSDITRAISSAIKLDSVLKTSLLQMQESFRNFKNIANVAAESAMTIEKITTGITENFRKSALNAMRISDSISKSFQVLKDLPELWIENSNQLNLWLLKMGWPPLLHVVVKFPYKLKDKCKDLKKTEAKEYVDKTIARYHSEEVLRQSILKYWKRRPCIKQRIHILEPAIEAHIRGEYALSVPAVLAQMEGIIAENFGHKGFMGSQKYIAYIKRLLKKDARENSEEVLLQFISDVILATFKHGTTIISDLSRHAILHGGDISYDNVYTSLKAILALDMITSKFEFASLASSSRYHRIDCSKLKHSRKARIFYTYDFQAKSDGKSPCKLCIPQRNKTQ